MDPTEILQRLRQVVTEVTPSQAAGRDALLLDIREPYEFATGVLPGAVLIPQGDLPAAVDTIAPDRTRPIIVYCATGKRSLFVSHWLNEHGFTDVASMAGGIVAWRAEGRPVVAEDHASEYQPDERYSRQMALAEVGVPGQNRLASARVLIVGAGGLGSPAALYLAAAGVGTIGIVDPDVVELSNLQRQVLHSTPRVGQAKVDSAAAAIGGLNPDVTVERMAVAITAANAINVMKGWDVVVDGTDSFPTRYLINDASLHLGVPVVHGSALGWEGRVSVFSPYQGPCYRCLFPVPPPADQAQTCSDAGVLGALTGVIGSIQGVETLKVVLGVGDVLVGKLLVYDALAQSFTTLRFERDPQCPACSNQAEPPRLVDYDEACLPALR